MFLPYRCKNPPESFPWATFGLIAANVYVYALTVGPNLVIREPILKEWGLKFSDVNPADFVASLFLHGDPFHLLGNMWFLYLFGASVEGRLRTGKFLLLYFVAGFTGDLLQLGLFGPSMPDTPGIGASGAIMGLMGAALYMFPYAQVNVFYGYFYYWGVTTWHLRWIALMFIGFDVLEALVFGAKSGVGNLAHVGGALGGFGMVLLLRARRDEEETSDAKATLADTRDYATLSTREIEHMAKLDPKDNLVALHWMARAVREPGGPSADCRHMFFSNLDRMAREQPAESVGSVLCGFATTPGDVPPKAALTVAMRLESGPAPQLALQLYDMVLRGGKADPQEALSALLRGGILCENRMGNPARAAAAYTEVLRRDPMGAFADQARHRLESLKRAGRV